MDKVALLIGVSDYQPDLTPLPGAAKDVEAIQRVLQDTEIGGFSEVKTLPNPDPLVMQEEIQTLFSRRQKDDLVLFFFSGHGIKDDKGKLYFATRRTRKNLEGELVRGTAVPASEVHDIMSGSRSKRQVVILDCCFSGAFAEGLSVKDDGFVDVKNQLGGEGRAVLTSSTSTQYSFEQQGADLSTYTRYIVEGLKTGSADRDKDGQISVDELHEYAKRKVQESVPVMNPQIYASKDSYNIKLAKVRIDDPKVQYRQEVENWASSGQISDIGRIALDALRIQLGLTPEEAAVIEDQVLKPHREYEEKLQQYERAFIAIRHWYPINRNIRNDLIRFQKCLGIRDEDIALIESKAKSQIIRNWFLIRAVVGSAFIGAIATFIISPIITYFPLLPLESNFSLGEKILPGGDTDYNKKDGVDKFKSGEFSMAIEKLKSYLEDHYQDSEALIYLNNAKATDAAEIGNKSIIKIGVSVPISRNPDVAKEILRGVAQAQKEVNEEGGINGQLLLQVKIADDENNGDIARRIATKFANDSDILAVVGHNSSEASIATAPVYQERRLAMITPTSDAKAISEYGSPVFHTTPDIKVSVEKLIDYAKEKSINKIVICYDAKAPASKFFQEEFKENFEEKFNKNSVSQVKCDFSEKNFDSKIGTILNQVKNTANGVMLVPGVSNTTSKAIEMAKAAKKQNLALLGSSTMNTSKTLTKGSDVEGMVIAIPWNPTEAPGKYFVDKLWHQHKVNWRNGSLTWRSAMAYDATKAIIEGIRTWNEEKEQEKKPRNLLIRRLASRDFKVEERDTATGAIPSLQCDRKTPVTLLEVKQKTPGVYEFEQL